MFIIDKNETVTVINLKGLDPDEVSTKLKVNICFRIHDRDRC